MRNSLRKFGLALLAAVLACTPVVAEDAPVVEREMDPLPGTQKPVAYVREDPEFAKDNGLECGYVFDAFQNESDATTFATIVDKVLAGEPLTDEEIAWREQWEASLVPYLNYHADFVVSFDDSVRKGTVQLTGFYPSWDMTMSFPLERDMAAGETLRLLRDGTSAASVKFSYYMILNQVVNFFCGADNIAPLNGMENWGTTMKVELRLYEPQSLDEDPTDISNYSPETGRYLVIGTYSHTFAKPEHDKVDEVQLSSQGTVVITDEEGNSVASPSSAQSSALTVVRATVAGNGASSTYEGTGVLDVPKNADGTVKAEVITALKAAASTQDLKNAIDSPHSYIQSYLKIRLDTVKMDNSSAVKALTYDVKPMVIARVTVDGETWQIVEAELANELIGSDITFRLPVTKEFTSSARVQHDGDTDRIALVQTSAGDRFVQVTANHFSLFTLTPEETATTEIDSANIVGIKRTTKNAMGEFVIGVPWLTYGGTDIPADKLISSGIVAGDEMSLWNGTDYDTWLYEDGAWTPAQKTSGTAVPAANALTVARGRAGWFKRHATGTFMQIGEYSTDAITTTVTAGSRAKQTDTLLFNPKYATFDLANITASAGDLVTVLGADGTAKTRLMWNGTSWGGYVKGQPIKIGTLTIPGADVWQTATDTTIPLATGFWYSSVGGAPTFNW